jgi:hypothetical protein
MNKNKKILFIAAMFIIGFAIGFISAECMGGHHHFWKNGYRGERMIQQPQGKMSADMQWTNYSFGGVDFKYPANWIKTDDQYCTPAGNCGQVGVTLTPNTVKAGEDKIGIGGRQVICAMFSNNRIKCTEINGVPFYTASENPDVLYVYNQIVASATTTPASAQ